MMQLEEILLQKCLKQIEDSLGWGTSKNWTNNDFENLSIKVQERTQVKLSITTLKRIWGKVKYDSAPTSTTLNALAQYAGYENWRTFSKYITEKNKNIDLDHDKPEETTLHSSNDKKKKYLFIPVLIGLLIIVTAFLFYKNSGKIDPNDYQFRSQKMVSEGVPNSVLFNYDATASPTDSVYIQQSWDNSRRQRVSKNNQQHTSIYYYPGYFKAKLVVADKIVKEHDVFITSNGWTAAIDQQPVPVYLKPEDYLKDSIIDVTTEIIESMKVPLQPQIPQIRIHNVRQMDSLKIDNFVFETTVKNQFSEGTGACQKIQVLILCKNDVFIIPLSSKRCVGDLTLFAADKVVRSSEADLTGFGCDLNKWTSLKVESKNKYVTFFINNKEVYEVAFENPATEIVGVQYRFQGIGSVKDTRFYNNKEEYIF